MSSNSEVVYLRVSEVIKARWTEAAEVAGMTLSAWAIQGLNVVAAAEPEPVKLAPKLAEEKPTEEPRARTLLGGVRGRAPVEEVVERVVLEERQDIEGIIEGTAAWAEEDEEAPWEPPVEGPNGEPPAVVARGPRGAPLTAEQKDALHRAIWGIPRKTV